MYSRDMNFIKISIIAGFVYAVIWVCSNPSKSLNMWMSNAHQNISRNTNLTGTLPDAFRLKITFNDQNYEHTHTFGGGAYLVNVEVNGSPLYLHSGELKQISCDLDCFVESEDLALTGSISIQRTITVLGNKKESEIRKDLNKEIVEIISNEIQKL